MKGHEERHEGEKEIHEGYEVAPTLRNQCRFWIASIADPIIKPVSFLCSSFSSCVSCLSCVSMFPSAANRFHRTSSLPPKGHEGPLFHSRMIRTAGRGHGSRANGSFPKGAGRLSEKSPARRPPRYRRDGIAWERGRPARILSLWPPLSISAMLQPPTLWAGTAAARPKESHGAVPG